MECIKLIQASFACPRAKITIKGDKTKSIKNATNKQKSQSQISEKLKI